jgi:hypothetical protein
VTANETSKVAKVQFVLVRTDEGSMQSAWSGWRLERSEAVSLKESAMLAQFGDVTPMRASLPAGARSPRIIGETLSFAGLHSHHHLL